MSGSRHLARKNAVQALYQWDITGQLTTDIERHYIPGEDINRTDLTYFRHLVTQVAERRQELDEIIKQYITRDIKDLNPVERSILRMSIYELKYEISNPYKSIINEGVDLAKIFGADQGYKFVNAVLDKVSKALRANEQKSN